MLRRASLCLTLLALLGCQGSDILKPSASPPSSPSFLISDGAHLAGGNPDFFFLPPMVKNPNKSPNWDAGAFNGNLTPNVDICELDATTEVQVNAGAPCKSGGYALSAVASVNMGAEHYQLNWKVPDSQQNSHKFYKIKVRVGTTQLGFADVEAASNSSQLKNVNSNEFVAMNDGQTLPIKFRIERFALCTVAGVGPCTSVVVNLQTGGTVSTILPGGTLPSGVTIPPQPPGAPAVTITVQSCLSLNPRAIDLPVFGPCVRVTADPPLPPSGLTNAATVFVCDVEASAIIGTNVASAAQKQRITLHRLDVDGEAQTVTALPHAPACGVALGAADASVKGFFASLARGRWKSAGGHLLALIGPKPLFAARRIDEGGGGFTPGFSDFQFALPAKMLKDAGDAQTAQPGTTLPVDPTVIVTDLGGEPVKGASVTFATTDGSVAPLSVVTLADGRAHAAWTLGATAGANRLKASGRGIAGADHNGPREGVDPFQPIQFFFDGTDVGAGPVTVLTGSQTFTATGVSNRVLIYGPTMSAPTTYRPDNEQTLAEAAGFSVTVASAETWSSYKAADFAKFRAIVFGDPTCSIDLGILAAADLNKAVWSPVVASGPAVVIGTDPQFHESQEGAQAKQLMTNGITYAASGTGPSTGLYVSLSCYYFSAPDGTPVAFLSAFGDFRVGGQGGLANTVTITNFGTSHPVMAGIRNAGLSNWNESVHEFFGFSTFPGSFHVLATGLRPSDRMNLPYIIAR